MEKALTPALDVDNAVRRYRSGFTLGPVTFQMRPETCFGLVGANGAGKTTLLRLILGLDRLDQGKVSRLGEPVKPYSAPRGVSGLIEEPRFFMALSAFENLRAAFPGVPFEPDRAASVLDEVGLGRLDDRPLKAFSQGMRQRLGLARVLMADPQLMVLDEPTNGLDPVGIRWMRKFVSAQTEKGRSVLLSSHLLHEVQQTAADFLMLSEGRVVASGAIEEIEGAGSLEDVYFSTLDGTQVL